MNSIEDRLIAVYFVTPDKNRSYRIAISEDYENFKRSTELTNLYFPDLELPRRVWKWVIHNFGITHMRQLFNERQYLIAVKISSEIREIYPKIKEELGEEMTKAVTLYLQFGLDQLLNYNSKFCMIKSGTRILMTWSRPGLFMTGLYVEANPFSNKKYSGSFLRYFSELKKTLKNIANYPYYDISNVNPHISQMDVQNLEFEEKYFDLIITDPPYYDSVPYAADSDFYYVWLKSTLNGIFPQLFIGNSTPKDEELVADPDLRGSSKRAKQFYEEGMTKAFKELYRVLKNNGLAVVIFAHKKSDAWETLLQACIHSGFVVTATSPVPMESRGGKLQRSSSATASLTSVVLVVLRKFDRENKTYFDTKFQNLITTKIKNRMQEFWDQQIRGADFFMCGIGPALKFLSESENLLDPATDSSIKISDYLRFVQNVMVNFAVEQISKSTYSGALDPITQFYLVWRWGYGMSNLPFDEMKILYQSLTIDLADLESTILRKKKGKAEYECLGPNERFKDITPKKREKIIPESMIDSIQLACYLWEIDERGQLEAIINAALLEYGDTLWMIAQALHDVLPECHERTQLQGLLQRYKKFVAREDYVPESAKPKKVQKTLFPSKRRKKKEQEESAQPEEEEEKEDQESDDE